MGYKELDVWQRSRQLVAEIYQMTEHFPPKEQFGLVSQMRRSAISLPANIAEGYGRRNPADFARFLRIAKGSLNELETLCILAEDLGFANDLEDLYENMNRLGMKLSNLQAKVLGTSSCVKEDSVDYHLE